MSNRRKIIRESSDGPFIEVGESHIKIGYDKDNFIVINAGGITQQGKLNIQGSPTDTTYNGLFSPQNEWLGVMTAGMISAPQYIPSLDLVKLIPGIIGLLGTFLQSSGI